MPSLRCDCDYPAYGTSLADLVSCVRAHARDVHEVDLDHHQILAALARQTDATIKTTKE